MTLLELMLAKIAYLDFLGFVQPAGDSKCQRVLYLKLGGHNMVTAMQLGAKIASR